MFLSKKDKPQDVSSSLDRLVGVTKHMDYDVLMDAPKKAARLKVSVIGDRKISAVPVVENKPDVLPEKKIKKIDSPPKAVEKSSVIDSRSRIVFDDPLISTETRKSNLGSAQTTKDNLRRERGYQKISPQGREGDRRSGKPHSRSAVDDVRYQVTHKIVTRSVGLLALLGCFAAIAYFASEPIAHMLERPLKSVAVEGQFQYLPKERAMSLIDAEIDGDFLQLDLGRLKNVLMSDPWVDNVYLSRRWPDTLVVKISEQKPIARWGENGYLNQRGDIIQINESDKLKGLPWLQGDEQNAREMLQQYQDISTLLRAHGLEIIALQCDNKKSWKIKLKNDAEIAIGREQVMEKLRRFVTVYDKFLSSVWGDVASIDVRYTNGVAVRWKPDSDMAKKNNNDLRK